MKKLKDLKVSDLMSNQEDAKQYQNSAQEAHKEKYLMDEEDKRIDQVAREMWEEEQKQASLRFSGQKLILSLEKTQG